jgi:hypothetical protein
MSRKLSAASRTVELFPSTTRQLEMSWQPPALPAAPALVRSSPNGGPKKTRKKREALCIVCHHSASKHPKRGTCVDMAGGRFCSCSEYVPGPKPRARPLPRARLVFEKKSPDVVVTFFKKERKDFSGRPFLASEAARAIREQGHWRIDRCAAVRNSWLPWEPIDSSPYHTLTAAKAAIRAYAASAPAE